MKSSCLVSVLLALTLWVTPDSQASVASQVIVDKPLNPATGYGFTSHYGKQHIFEDFTLDSGSSFNRITWYGLFSDGLSANEQAEGSFDIFLFDNDSTVTNTTPGGIEITDLPSTNGPAFFIHSASGVLGSGTGVTDPLQGGDVKSWSVDVPLVTLDADTYWISIRAASSEPGFYLWHHSEVGADGYTVHGGITTNDVPGFTVSDEALDRDEMAFLLIVPEPTTFTLLGLGSLALVMVRRRK